MGKNTLSSIMSAEAGISSTINHNLRATGATNFIPCNCFRENNSGHRSVEVLQTYERVSEDQYKSASNLRHTKLKRRFRRKLGCGKYSEEKLGCAG